MENYRMTTDELRGFEGFENRYEISNRGRIRSIGRTMIAKDGYTRKYPDKYLKLKPHKNTGYCRARLYHDNGKTYEDFSVHRLVALHFHKNPDNLPWVNHLDTCRSNNDVLNLAWCTVAENLTHHDCHIRGGEKRKKKVFQYLPSGKFIRVWSWAQEAHEAGFNKNLVGKVCRGTRKRYKGFLWSYT